MLEFDVVVIGGGIVGLATAAAASKKFSNVLLLERNYFNVGER
ncbi:FAD-dependent oxidoreductase [Alphaproteobacteria bacterium]|nr:FAD-dependent oxidoreductase [Alphaproteobacteria bacterium]